METHVDDFERLKFEHRIYADLASTMIATLDFSEILTIIMQKVRDLLKPTNWSLLLMEADGEHLRFEIAEGQGGQSIKGSLLKVGEGIAGWVAQSGESLLIRDVQSDLRFCRRFDEMNCFHTRSVICVPMISRGKILGVIELVNRIEEGAFSELDMRSLKTLAEFAAIAIHNANLFRKVERLSLTDDHTSLFNMRFFYEELDRQLAVADRQGGEISLIFLDLDHFKSVNDVYGHLCGSKTLREVGLLIKQVVRGSDFPVRYGGDEFVVLMVGSGKVEALEFAKYLRDRVNSQLFLAEEGINLHVTASFGVASYPSDADSKGKLLSLADSAMYKVKGTTRDGIAAA